MLISVSKESKDLKFCFARGSCAKFLGWNDSCNHVLKIGKSAVFLNCDFGEQGCSSVSKEFIIEACFHGTGACVHGA